MSGWLLAVPLLVVSLPAALWVGGALALDRYGARVRPRGSYDAIVVAGCGVLPSGRASPALRRRTLLAIRVYREGHAARIVLTGGVGTWPPSEARAAAVICREEGVPEDALVLEEASTTTEENARFAAELIGRGRVLVVSDGYHAFRCARTFARHFGEADAIGEPPRGWPRARMALREVGAVIGYGWRGLLRRPPVRRGGAAEP